MRAALFTLALALLSLPAFAVFQYEVYELPLGEAGGSEQRSDGSGAGQGQGQGQGIKGSTYFVRVTEGSGRIYIMDRIDSLESMSENKQLLSIKAEMSTPNSYGSIAWPKGKPVPGSGETMQLPVAKGKDGEIFRTGYELGQFSAGDQVGIWLTVNDTRVTGASVFGKNNPINSRELEYREAFFDVDAGGMAMHELRFSNTGSIYFGIYSPDAPGNGQPLPGALATLLLGGVVSGAAGMRRRRQRS